MYIYITSYSIVHRIMLMRKKGTRRKKGTKRRKKGMKRMLERWRKKERRAMREAEMAPKLTKEKTRRLA